MPGELPSPDGRFPTTRWSAVVGARSPDRAERERSWDALVRAYWKPAYKHLRVRWKSSPEDAEDTIQGFFERAMEKDFFATYDPQRARFRTFLRVCLERFVSNGRGGMGVVYEAVDTQLEREVAIKVSSSLPASRDLCERLRSEARVVARLEHPAIVPVHDLGTLPDGRMYYVMKLVRGERLDEWARPPRDRREVLRLFQRICEAVAFAHARGVLHRDLKPANVMVGPFGEALVMDWGIARERSAGTPADAEGSVLGTPGYMAPEQARGELASLDERADVYGLGAILRALLAHEGVRTPRPLASICGKATASERTDRYGCAMDLADEVGRFLDAEPVRAHRATMVETAARFASRHRVVLSLLGAYVVVRMLLVGLSH